MKSVKITVMRKTFYEDLSLRYENKIEHACFMNIGQVFISENALMPKDFCESAWLNLYPFVLALASGSKDIFDHWMKDPYSAMISCNDGFRPVSFLLETIKE